MSARHETASPKTNPDVDARLEAIQRDLLALRASDLPAATYAMVETALAELRAISSDSNHKSSGSSGRATSSRVDSVRTAERVQATLDTIIETTTDAIVATDLVGTITTWNPGAERLYGYAAGDVVGTPITKIVPRSVHAELDEMLAAVARGDAVGHHVSRRRHRNGHELIVSVSVAPVKDRRGRIVGAATIARDVTAEQRATETLRRRDAQLRELVRAASDAVVFITAEGRIERVNPAAACMFGYEGLGLVGRSVTCLMPEPHASAHPSYVERYERTREPWLIGRRRTVTAKRRDGTHFPIELSITELENDESVRYAAFIRDISERRDMERQLLEAERLATIGTTASMFAHEVGGPLNNIYIHVQLLERELERLGVASRVHGRFGGILREVARLNGLLEEFRMFYRRQEFELTPIELGPFLRRAVSFELPGGRSSPIEVDDRIPDGLPPVLAHEDKLTQVVVNLVRNAVEAMPDGGRLSLFARADGPSVSFEVADTGTGIPKDVNVFEPFKTTKPHGTGLGLAIVRQIVHAHGGTISYASDPGRGTVFRVILRAALPEEES